MSAEKYLQVAAAVLEKVHREQLPQIQAAAELIADAIAAGGMLHAFGTGHSHMLAEEIFYRAGGLCCANAMLDPGLDLMAGALRSTALERLPGYAAAVFADYRIEPGDVMIIASNSGRNAVPVEMAMLAREKGVKVVAITSLAHSRSLPSRHASGKRLFELADVVIDNCGVPGDAAVEIPGLDERVGPTSTVAGAAIVNALVAEVCARLWARGVRPPLIVSANLDGSDARNRELMETYGSRLRHL